MHIRTEDIPLLIRHFLKRYGDGTSLTLSPKVVDFFAAYRWPGNVRELENIVRMLLATQSDVEIKMNHLPPVMRASFSSLEPPTIISENDDKLAFETAVDKFERAFFTFHLEENEGNVSKTAEAVGLSRSALHQKIKKYNLKV